MGGVRCPLCIDQCEGRINRACGAARRGGGYGGNCERADAGSAGAGCNCEETSPRRVMTGQRRKPKRCALYVSQQCRLRLTDP
jgi:hypothetical protein